MLPLTGLKSDLILWGNWGLICDHCRSKIFFQTNETRNYRFRYAIRWLRHGYKTEGLLSLWRGNTATLARIVPYSAINFMSFEQYKKLLRVEEPGRPGYYRCRHHN